MNKILVAIDGSRWTRNIIDYISSMFSKKDSEIVLFHVINPIPEPVWDYEKDPLQKYKDEPWLLKLKEMIENIFFALVEELIDKGFEKKNIKLKVQIRKTGIARDIIQEAQKGYDLVVIGRKGHTLIKDLTMGPVTNKLLNHIDKFPLLLVGEQILDKNITIALDGSENSLKIIHQIGKLFQNTNHEIFLIHVIRQASESLYYYSEKISEDLSYSERMCKAYSESIFKFLTQRCLNEEFINIEKEKENILKKSAKILKNQYGFKNIKIELIKDSINFSRAASIVNIARANQCGTIVVGRKGISKVKDFLIGRVTNKIIQLAEEKSILIL